MVGDRRVKLVASNETTTTSMDTGDNNHVVSTVQPTTTQQVSFLSLSLSLSISISRRGSSFSLRRRVSSTDRSRDVSRPRENESGSLSRETPPQSVAKRGIAYSTAAKLGILYDYSVKTNRCSFG